MRNTEEVGAFMLKIQQTVIDFLIGHAVKDSPIEACGYLGEKDDIVQLPVPLTNVDASREHFTLDPKEQFACVKKIRSLGMKLRAVYHSHPATPARLSEEDIRLAVDPDLSYVIVSLEGGPTIKAFRVLKGVVQKEELIIV
jgi:proteasome lid subunit RPN8/RPN11